MHRGRFLSAIAVAAALSWAGAFGSSAAEGATEPADAFDRLSGAYLEAYYAAHPVRATQLGVHAHDARLPDLSRGAVRRRIEQLQVWIARLEGIDRAGLAGAARFDHEILEYAARAELLELAEVRSWQRNPMLYNRVMADGVASLIDRRFAGVEIRLARVVARLGRYGQVITAARKNLEDVPRPWTELAVRNTEGHIRFLAKDVPAALNDQGLETVDPKLVARWERARRNALEQLEAFVRWLETDLLPRSDGDFRLGRNLFERKLLYEEHIDLGVEELTRLNETAIERYRVWVAKEAARVDDTATVAEVMQRIARRHPTAEELIPTARRYVMQAYDVVLDKQLLTLPTKELPIIRPTPEFARTGFASMSAPGPFESVATEAYYNITNVDPAWDEDRQQQHLTYFNYGGLLGVSVHEAMPGHFVQMLYRRALPTDVRKVFAPGTLVEGWAHYTEQMMVDEGLGGGEPAVRLGQLRRALQRHARWYAGLALHTGNTSIDAAAERFAEIAYFAAFPAYRETLRGTYNPTYLYYALGRMQILELREDYRAWLAARDEPFSLQDFHDRFLRLGLPLPLARQALMPEDPPQEVSP